MGPIWGPIKSKGLKDLQRSQTESQTESQTATVVLQCLHDEDKLQMFSSLTKDSALPGALPKLLRTAFGPHAAGTVGR
jgi:hypothetical protein